MTLRFSYDFITHEEEIEPITQLVEKAARGVEKICSWCGEKKKLITYENKRTNYFYVFCNSCLEAFKQQEEM